MPPREFKLVEPEHEWDARSEASDAQEKKLYQLASTLSLLMKEYAREAGKLLRESEAPQRDELVGFISTWKDKFEEQLGPDEDSQ